MIEIGLSVLLAVVCWTMVLRVSVPAGCEAWRNRVWPRMDRMAWLPLALIVSAFVLESLPVL